ncbi:MAG: hypothetical protein MR629_01920 [Helicobacter sp.]|nr:hypothetical protein [Helicobacter sp. 10-6591]MCI6217286.1 hypothetical protein [Helicobacter sp.]MCI7484556.1 hypothetical protein [Helicobacter sp.]MDD7566982.1 hypothetical protein [Helicobacter sp.]MDY5741195.1 hypothetical protein [Helicobacter sp.]
MQYLPRDTFRKLTSLVVVENDFCLGIAQILAKFGLQQFKTSMAVILAR